MYFLLPNFKITHETNVDQSSLHPTNSGSEAVSNVSENHPLISQIPHVVGGLTQSSLEDAKEKSSPSSKPTIMVNAFDLLMSKGKGVAKENLKAAGPLPSLDNPSSSGKSLKPNEPGKPRPSLKSQMKPRQKSSHIPTSPAPLPKYAPKVKAKPILPSLRTTIFTPLGPDTPGQTEGGMVQGDVLEQRDLDQEPVNPADTVPAEDTRVPEALKTAPQPTKQAAKPKPMVVTKKPPAPSGGKLGKSSTLQPFLQTTSKSSKFPLVKKPSISVQPRLTRSASTKGKAPQKAVPEPVDAAEPLEQNSIEQEPTALEPVDHISTEPIIQSLTTMGTHGLSTSNLDEGTIVLPLPMPKLSTNFSDMSDLSDLPSESDGETPRAESPMRMTTPPRNHPPVSLGDIKTPLRPHGPASSPAKTTSRTPFKVPLRSSPSPSKVTRSYVGANRRPLGTWFVDTQSGFN